MFCLSEMECGHCGCGEGSLDRWQGFLVLLKGCVSQQWLSIQTQRGLRLSFLSPSRGDRLAVARPGDAVGSC